jgi:hypothetical protein
VQRVLLFPDNDGMPRVGAPGKTDDYLGFAGQIIHDFPLSLIAPLRADDYNVHLHLYKEAAVSPLALTGHERERS